MTGALNIKTHYSLLSSMIKIPNLVLECIKKGYKAIAITDDNLYGTMEFYKECINHNIKPIIGLTVTLNNKSIILYAQNYDGYKNLLKINTKITEGNLTFAFLTTHSDNLISVIPYENKNLFEELNKLYKHTFIGIKNELELNEIDKKYAVYFNQTLCLNDNEVIYLNYLTSIKEGVELDDFNYKNCFLETSAYLKTKYPDLIKNNDYLVDLCNIEFKSRSKILPKFKTPNDVSSYDYLRQLCVEGIKRIFGSNTYQKYIDRLKYELEVIKKMGFEDYFLIVHDYVKFAKEQNIIVGTGRGSAPGSLVAYLLNITEIDPLKHDLLFERFLNPERITMPDIDVDFEDTRREEVINYCINKYGNKKVANIITFGTMGSKQALRDVGRVKATDSKLLDKLANLIDSKNTLEENFKKNDKIKMLLKNNSRLNETYMIAMKLEGLKRHTSMHAAGIVMADDEIDNYVPLIQHKENSYICGFSHDYLEELGLIKMDFLGLKNLSLISQIVKDIKHDLNVDINLNNINYSDALTIELFNKGQTEGVFQFESSGMINFLKKFKPTSFEDVVSAIAIYRPGPMKNIDSYIRRKNNLEKIDYFHEDLTNILKPTYGIIIYQEQIMQIAHVLADYTFAEADVLRRAMSKKKEEVLKNEKDKFINNAVKKGYHINLATKIFDLILKFASYGFNKSHSVAYTDIAFKLAFLKAHYPLHFIKNNLTSSIGSVHDTKKYIYEARTLNINISAPDITISTNEYVVAYNKIIFPLTGIKNVGINAVNKILEERNKKAFVDIFDFVKRTYSMSVNKKTILSLNEAGCFKSLNINKKTVDNNIDEIINYAEISKNLDEEYTLKPIFNNEHEYSNKEMLNHEINTLGFYLTNHPITNYKNNLSLNINVADISTYFDKVINIILMIEQIKEINTKNNEKMCFLYCFDELNKLDVVLFPKIYEMYDLNVGDVIKVTGKVEKRFDKYQIIVNNIEVLK